MDTLLTNACLVLPDRVVERGWLRAEQGRIVDLGEGDPADPGADLDGDVLIPGLVELHTDHLESHYAPRPSVRWSAFSAVLSYDAQIAASGITTVFDSFRVGSDADSGSLGSEIWKLTEAVRTAGNGGHLRVDHRTHLRCELASPDVLETAEAFVDRFAVDLISLMDHTPGQRQFRSLDAWRRFYTRKSPMSAAELDGFIAKRLDLHARYAHAHRQRLVELAKSNGIALASHDDTTVEHVAESLADGIAVAEFPTTGEAARASHEGGLRVMMGAPNLVRGGSHSGNVAALELAEDGVLDILSSDYVPASLLMAAFALPSRVPGIALHDAIRTVTETPAQATGLTDRGALVPGLRADLVRVHVSPDGPVVRQVWREGRVVA
ncbi:alpha-D-ribose 1-methylphosphonate 5-triphosphate diphosphatase [Marinivivus vitaminiproducens]|uniref:alpha-D-ribose 1-methylphosphonate 5-triphosphate diphosphatase n=1 Tax=Marinivivus vitaminiproducens TaxID=3035935 RepID=UPI00279929E6|nr:alpha-D-ribose 1-methylphosphonate 5-triphosphate diphosphatase [Geminicoccaceae bacterium SCSIO 64248]